MLTCVFCLLTLSRLLKNIYERHAPVLLTMARGAYELRQKYPQGSSEFYDLEGACFPACLRHFLACLRRLPACLLVWNSREGGRHS